MGKKSKKKTKWLPLNLVTLSATRNFKTIAKTLKLKEEKANGMQWRRKQKSCWVIGTGERSLLIRHYDLDFTDKNSEKEDGSQDSSTETVTDNTSEDQYSNFKSVDNLVPDEIRPSCTPSGSYYPLMKHPVYTVAFPLPHVLQPHFVPQNNYRPLQPLDWFNQRIPANCQVYHTMAPHVPRYFGPRRGYENPFYWNTVLINPYSNFTTNQINSDNPASGYVYPGHYYGPASLSGANDVTPTRQQSAEDNGAGERRIQSKKRKRKRKRKLRLKTTSASSLRDESVSSSSDSNGLMGEELEGCIHIPSSKMEIESVESLAPVDLCQVHMSRDQLPHLPLVDDLFAVTFVDEIISKAIEIALKRENSKGQVVEEKSTEEDELEENEGEDLEAEELDNSLDDVIEEFDDSSIKDVIEELDNSSVKDGIEELDNLSARGCVEELDNSSIKGGDNGSDIASNVSNNVDNIVGDSPEGIEQVDDHDNEGGMSPNANFFNNINSERSRNIINSEQDPYLLAWSQRNGHIEDNEPEDNGGERELVTEIVFVSETSFMDESHAADNAEGTNNEDDQQKEDEEEEEDKLSELSEDNSSNISSKELAEEEIEGEEEEFVGETYMDIDDHQQFYDPQKVKDYYQICTNMDVPDSPLERSDKSAKPVFEPVVTSQPLPASSMAKMKIKEEAESMPLPNRHAEIVLHELDDVSECGSEDVDVIGHRYQKSDTTKNIYVNQLSLAAELLKAQQDIPYDEELKPIEDAEAPRMQDTATASHSNRHVYDNYYGNSSGMEMRPMEGSRTESCKEVSDSGVQSEESGDEEESRAKAMAQGGANRSAYKGVLGANAKPLSSMLKGKSDTDPLCLCCSVM